MHRFFIPKNFIKESLVEITGELVHQMRDVLRLSSGDCITLLDNSGWQYRVELQQIASDAVTGKIIEKARCTNEPLTRIVLYQSLLKANKFEFVLQKGTELGIGGFVPVISGRTVVAADKSSFARKMPRWERIIRESSEQSRRGIIPFLAETLPFADACRSLKRTSLILWENENALHLRDVIKNGITDENQGGVVYEQINLLVGPEGGFSESEIKLARDYGAITVTMGRRILRAETAGIIAAAIILFMTRDLG